MKWIFSSSFIHRVHIVHSIFTQSNQRFCMQPEQWLMSYYSTHSQGLMKKANNMPRVNAAKKREFSCQNGQIFYCESKLNNFPYHCMHSCSILQKKSECMAKNFEGKKMKFALLTIVDAFLWFYVAIQCKKRVRFTVWRMSFRVNKLHYY